MINEETITEPSRARKSTTLCATPSAKALGDLLRTCHAEGELGLVTGEPGVGKTSAIRLYTASARHVAMITMSPATNTLAGALARIVESVHGYPDRLSASALSSAIRARLAAADVPQMLVIDEAQNLCDAALEEIRSIHDATANLSIVFVGARELRERLSGRRWAQFTSRLFLNMHLEAPRPDDVDALCDAASVDGKRQRDQLRRLAAGPGGLRVVVKVLGIASKLAGGGKPMGPEHVDEAVRHLSESTR